MHLAALNAHTLRRSSDGLLGWSRFRRQDESVEQRVLFFNFVEGAKHCQKISVPLP
jgi:hypothetical protein